MSSKYVIGLTEPGPVLQDFQTLLDFVGEDGELVSKKQMVFASNTLVELNQKMSKPLKQDKKRPVPKTFPHLEALYLCAKWLGFFEYTNEGSRKRAHLNVRALQAWQERTPTEQYFSLLDIWLFGDPNEYRAFLAPITRLGRLVGTFFGKVPVNHAKLFKNEYQVEGLLAGLELFGLVVIQHAEPDAGEGWAINSMALTALGEYVVQALSNVQQSDHDAFFDRVMKEEEPEQSLVVKTFRDDFPDLIQLYVLPETAIEREGVFIFKIFLGKVWRRIAIVSQADLDDLATAILDAFGFDNDHLYCFKFLSIEGVLKEYYRSESMCGELATDEVRLAELSLPLKSSMEFVFDFGACWEFELVLEKVDVDYDLEYCEVVDAKGAAPAQYGDEIGW